MTEYSFLDKSLNRLTVLPCAKNKAKVAMDSAFIQARIDALKVQAVAASDLLTVLLLDDTPANKSYTLETGQSTITVTKKDAPRISNLVDSLFNQLAVWESRQTGSGVKQSVPAW